MKNKNVLIGTATAMFCIAVACVLLAFTLTKPIANNHTESSKDVVINTSTDDAPTSTDTIISKPEQPFEDVESVESSEEVSSPEIILPPETVLFSDIALVYNVKESTVIFEKNADIQTAPASLTKLVTAMVALEHMSPTRSLTVGEEINMIGEN